MPRECWGYFYGCFMACYTDVGGACTEIIFPCSGIFLWMTPISNSSNLWTLDLWEAVQLKLPVICRFWWCICEYKCATLIPPWSDLPLQINLEVTPLIQNHSTVSISCWKLGISTGFLRLNGSQWINTFLGIWPCFRIIVLLYVINITCNRQVGIFTGINFYFYFLGVDNFWSSKIIVGRCQYLTQFSFPYPFQILYDPISYFLLLFQYVP